MSRCENCGRLLDGEGECRGGCSRPTRAAPLRALLGVQCLACEVVTLDRGGVRAPVCAAPGCGSTSFHAYRVKVLRQPGGAK